MTCLDLPPSRFPFQVPDGRHDVLLRLRADAEAAAHPRGGRLLRGLPHPGRAACALEVPGRDVQPGRVHPELPRRPGHHQPLQAAARHQDDQEGGAGAALLYQHGAHGNLGRGRSQAMGLNEEKEEETNEKKKKVKGINQKTKQTTKSAKHFFLFHQPTCLRHHHTSFRERIAGGGKRRPSKHTHDI